jgi:membrane protein YdbS with pleckstrin-like domain
MKPMVLRPSGLYLFKLFLLALPISLVGSVLVILLGVIFVFGGWTWLVILGLFGTYMGIKLLLLLVYYRSLRYEISESEVVVYAGILTRIVKHVPFRTVTNLQITRGPLDRLLGLGSLDIQTAGASATVQPEERLVGLANIQQVYEHIAGELRRFQSAMSPTQAGEEFKQLSSGYEQQLLVAILDELRAIRARVEQT